MHNSIPSDVLFNSSVVCSESFDKNLGRCLLPTSLDKGKGECGVRGGLCSSVILYDLACSKFPVILIDSLVYPISSISLRNGSLHITLIGFAVNIFIIYSHSGHLR